MVDVLIVDDELSIRDTLSEFVREEGYDVAVAADAAAALELLKREAPSVVVTDIILPRVTGIELLRQIHEVAPDVQVIMITGEPTADTAAEAVRLGAFDYLSKPVLRSGFTSAVASAMRVSELARLKRELEAQNARYQQHLEEEVEKKTAELRASEEKYRTFIDNANEAVFVAQGDRLRFVNPKTIELMGYSEERIFAMPFSEIIHPEDLEMVIDRHARRLAGDDPIDQYEFRIVTAGAETRWIEIRPVRITWEGQPATLNFAIDVTERKRAEAALRASEERYRAVIEHANEAIFIVDGDHIVFANPETETLVGMSMDELIDRSFFERIHEDDLELVRTTIRQGLAHAEAPSEIHVRLVRPDGVVRWIAVRGVNLEWEGRAGILCFSHDITDWIEAEQENRRRQNRIRRINEALLYLATQRVLFEGELDAALDSIVRTAADVLEVEQVGIWLVDSDLMTSASERFFIRSEKRYRTSEIQRFDDTPVFFDALRKNRVLAISDVKTDPLMAEFDEKKLSEMGVSSVLDAAIFVGGELVGDLTFMHVGEAREWSREEIEFATEATSLIASTFESYQRRQAESALERREREYEALFEDSPVPLWLEDFSEVKGFIEELKASEVTDLTAYLAAHPAAIDEAARRIRVLAVNAAAVAMREGQSEAELRDGSEPLISEGSRPSFAEQLAAIWAGETFYEGTAVDTSVAGKPRHAAVRWTVMPGYEETLGRVLVATTDVTAVVEAEQALREALTGTIEAIGLTTETRDPYTAGHQRRVTELAVAIAEELGLKAEQVEGIRAAGLLHDIGKMAIPAEILSKPSRLSEMEMALIQSHPRIAYDILKSIAFPWPLAMIVLQHHERIDGSGYPEGLHGDEILLEARILAVADTMEAMASHRPYRASLGTEAALAEIEGGRGTRYDADAADACVRLFREDRFAFESPTATV